MAVPDPNLYYKNMAAGKTSTGGQANYGQMQWAKAQLAKVPDPALASQPAPLLPVPKPSGTVPAPPKTPTATPSMNPITNSNPVPAPPIPPPPQQPAPTFSAPQYNDWLQKQNETFANLEKLVNTPFAYDPNTDPGYLAQRQLAQLRAGDASRNALESANERGIMGSSMNISQLGQIQQRAEQEAAAYIPQYRDQAYGRFQDQLKNAGTLLSEARNLRGDQFNESVTEAEITGSYLPAGAQQLVNQIQSLKTQAEVKGLPNTEVKALSAQADKLRVQLQSMGVDISKIGADTSLANSSVGQRTLAGQMQDYNQMYDDRQFDYGVGRDGRADFESDRRFDEDLRRYNQDFEYTQGRDTTKDAQWQQEFDRILKQDGIQNALAWAANSISKENSNTSRMNADNSKLMDIWQATGSAPEGIQGVAAGTPYGSELDRSYRQAQVDQMGAKVDSGTTKITAKQSADNLVDLKSKVSGASLSDAINYIQNPAVRDQFSDSDYRTALKYIEDNLR